LKLDNIEKYKNFTQEKFLKLTNKTEKEPLIFFTVPFKKLELKIDFQKNIIGKYVTLLFLNSHKVNTENIQINQIHLIGYEGERNLFGEIQKIPENFDIIKPEFKIPAYLSEETYSQLNYFEKERIILILFTSFEKEVFLYEKSIIKYYQNEKKKDEKDFVFFYLYNNIGFGKELLQNFGIKTKKSLLYVKFDSKKYLIEEKEEILNENTFIQKFKKLKEILYKENNQNLLLKNNIKEYFITSSRPKDDKDEEFGGIIKIFKNHFRNNKIM
jgi:hypothetical protein